MKKFKRIVSSCAIFTFIISNFLFVTSTKATIIETNSLKERVNFNFNTGWKFYRGESLGAESIDFYDDLWESVNLPHSARLEPRSWKGTTPSYQGICWYRRDFTLDKNYEGKKVFVEFEGAMGNTEVFINGKNITKHYGGYLPFTVDLSEFMNFNGNNVIAVKLNNSNDHQTPPGKPQNGLDFLYYGGLYRNVNLYLTDNIYVTDSVLADKVADGGVFVTYPEVSKEKVL